MIILIPLGGTGERFKINNYKKPKALINIFGKPIIYYLLENLKLNDSAIVYIPYNHEYSNYRIESLLKKDFPNIKFIFFELKNNTRGAAETINIALNNINLPDQPILCLDGDNFYLNDIVNIWNEDNKIIVFEDLLENPIYSYTKINENNDIVDIVEKVKISNLACTGAYGFKSYKNLLEYTNIIIKNNIMQKNEFYTSGVIKEMIKNNFKFTIAKIDKADWQCLGTPMQLKQFYNNFPAIKSISKKSNIKKMRICFDLDNTLVTFPETQNDYTSVKPIEKNIKLLKYLKKFGHTIIIYTARRMNTHNGCIGKIMSDIGKITFNTLENFGIPYDELYFGKPYADLYIDDLALNCFDDMEKELGYYIDIIEPRDFNTIETNTIEIYTKKSEDLSGEIYYYRNIPSEIKDLFPLFIDYDINNKWYKMEKINGLTLSTLYLSELLTENTLESVMGSIKRIHSIQILNSDESNNINIYENYSKKIKNRYEIYDYSKYHNSNEIYNELMSFFENYEKNNYGKFSTIHGDPVFTNIIINNYEKIKFIDMRGKVGNKLTIYGDCLYDWAKFYQSLIGYDEILLDKKISLKYKNRIIDVFETKFIDMFSENDLTNLKFITKSLLFSLIPLHNNEKCYKYYDLIGKII
jgi:capsule biosynthesis phosphatase